MRIDKSNGQLLDDGIDDDDDRDPNKALKLVRFVFGLLLKDTFTFYKDLHMDTELIRFERDHIEFADMGVAHHNDEREEKFYFIKMIHRNDVTNTRDIYLIAFAEP